MTILNTLHNIDNESVDSRFLNNSSSDPSKPGSLDIFYTRELENRTETKLKNKIRHVNRNQFL